MAAVSIACPFCGLVCDDLLFEKGRVDARGCAKGQAGFARQPTAGDHRIGGKPAAYDDAVAAAATLLGNARLPLITGLGADIAGLRALIALADRLGAVIDRWQSGAQLATLSLMQREGALAATFGEIANRADAVLLLGCDPSVHQPRFFERLVRNRSALYRQAPPVVTFLGPTSEAPVDPAVTERVLVDRDRLLDALSALAAILDRRKLAATAATDLPLADLRTLAERFAAARYGVVVWDIAKFPVEAQQPAMTVLLHFLRRLTRKTRCVGLPVAGGDNAQGASQAMLWQAGWPGRLCFAAGIPVHDPWLYDAERLVAAREIDVLMWVSAIAAAPPPATDTPTVALLAPGAPSVSCTVEIRVGVPGLDHAGTMVRADTIVALPLAAAQPSDRPSVAAAARAILTGLGPAP